jgi:hypothetical protein
VQRHVGEGDAGARGMLGSGWQARPI